MSNGRWEFLGSSEETLGYGRKMAEGMKGGEIFALVGELGAGKTTLTRGLMEGLGYGEAVTSPTFSLVQEYRGGRLEVFHFDFYRVENEGELIELGWDEYLERGGVVVVEWPNRYPGLLPTGTRWIFLEREGEGRRIREELRSDGNVSKM